MNYRFFQETGLSVSTIGIGTNRFGHKVDQSEVVNIIDECLNLGINHIDTANVYAKGESEKLIGKAIKKIFAAFQSDWYFSVTACCSQKSWYCCFLKMG